MTLSGEILIPRERIAARVAEMARRIAVHGPALDRTLDVLCVMDGAYMFCADLVRELPMPLRMGFVRVVSVERGGDPARVRLPEQLAIRGADLLVVEDILDSGRTLSRLVARLESLAPRRLRVAVLLDKPIRRRVEIRADYVGFTVGDHWIVGYGLDHEGRYRNLPDISYVK